jgi:hypothetical protein
VLALIADRDGRWPDGFAVEGIRGYARPHGLTLALPEARSGTTLLLITGWTDYAFSGDNLAAHQAGLALVPPSLQVRGPDRRWRTLNADIGFPAGRPQTLVVAVDDRDIGPSREVRIETSMRVYWDRIAVDTRGTESAVRPVPLRLARADLHWRGFSEPEDGRSSFRYDYERVTLQAPWKLLPGRYTRLGDVRELLDGRDSLFVVSRPGDEIALAFDASGLPRLDPAARRTYLLYSVGFSKEMDLNSASPDRLGPLPFHGMTQYPYAWPETYPDTPAHQAYLDRFNTRIVPRSIPRIETTLTTPGTAAAAAAHR